MPATATPTAAADEPVDVSRMSLGDHLEELRYRLFLGLIGPIIAAIIMLIFGRQIVSFLTYPALVAMQNVGLTPRMVNPTFTSAFAVYMKVSMLGGLIVGIPWLMYQLWRFVAPGLYPSEQRIFKMLVPFSAALMVAGVAFLYYLLLPLMLWFLLNFAVTFDPPALPDPEVDPNAPQPHQVEPLNVPLLNVNPEEPQIGDIWVHLPTWELRVMIETGDILRTQLAPARMMEPLIQLDQYIRFVMVLALVFSIAFQLPLVMFLLAKVGIINYEQLKSVRRYAILVIAVLSAMATPGDPLSMIGLMIALMGLFELGMLLIKWFVYDAEPDQA